MPIIVMAISKAQPRWYKKSHQPAMINQITFPKKPRGPVPMSSPEIFSRETMRDPKGHKAKRPMLKVARAQGIPIMVTSMIKEAINQPVALTKPPKISQRMFSKIDIERPYSRDFSSSNNKKSHDEVLEPLSSSELGSEGSAAD